MRVPLEGGRRSQRVSEAETVSVRMRKINRSCPTVLARLSCCEHRSLGFQSRTRVSETLDDDDSKLFYDSPFKVTFTGFDTLTVFARYFVRLRVNAASFPPRTAWRDLTRRTWRWKFSRRWKVRKKCGRSFKYAHATRTNEESVGVTGQLIGREIRVDTFSSSDFRVATCCIGISVIALVVHDRCWSRVGYWSNFFIDNRGWVK